MASDLFDNTSEEIVPGTPEETLLEKALSDTECWMMMLESEAEDPNILLTPEQLDFFPNIGLDCETIALQSREDNNPSWAIGFSGHGLSNIYFCCSLFTTRLKIAVSIPYRTSYDESQTSPEEAYQANRASIRATCSTILFLLRHEIEKRDYAQNNPDARLTVTCDRNGAAFQIDDTAGTIDKGTSWRILLEKHLSLGLTQSQNLQFFQA